MRDKLAPVTGIIWSSPEAPAGETAFGSHRDSMYAIPASVLIGASNPHTDCEILVRSR